MVSAGPPTEEETVDYAQRLEKLKAKVCILRMIDYLIVDGARMRMGFFVFLLRAARSEVEKIDLEVLRE